MARSPNRRARGDIRGRAPRGQIPVNAPHAGSTQDHGSSFLLHKLASPRAPHPESSFGGTERRDLRSISQPNMNYISWRQSLQTGNETASFLTMTNRQADSCPLWTVSRRQVLAALLVTAAMERRMTSTLKTSAMRTLFFYFFIYFWWQRPK